MLQFLVKVVSVLGVRTFVQKWLPLEYDLFNWLIMFKVLKIKAIRLMFYDSFLQNLSSYTTVRLTFLAHSVLVRPNFQGLPWCKCYGLGEDKL